MALQTRSGYRSTRCTILFYQDVLYAFFLSLRSPLDSKGITMKIALVAHFFFSIFSDSHKVHINIFTLDSMPFFLVQSFSCKLQIFHWIVALLFNKGLPHFSWPLSYDNNDAMLRSTPRWGVGMCQSDDKLLNLFYVSLHSVFFFKWNVCDRN